MKGKFQKVRESTKNNSVPPRQITLRLTVSKLSENFAHNNFGKNMNAAIKMIHSNDVRIFEDVAKLMIWTLKRVSKPRDIV